MTNPITPSIKRRQMRFIRVDSSTTRDRILCGYRCQGGGTTVGAVYEGVNELDSNRHSPPRRGGVDAPSMKWTRSEIGASGVVSSANFFRPKDFAGLTTPAASSSVASQLLLMPQPSPPLRGGESP